MNHGLNYLKKVSLLGLSVLSVTMIDVRADEDTPMAKEMQAVSRSLKELRKISKTDYAAGAAAARNAHEALLKSMAYTPTMVKEMPAGLEKEKALADARKLLGESYAALCELELAYLDKSDAKIAAAMKKIKVTKGEGHKKYTDD